MEYPKIKINITKERQFKGYILLCRAFILPFINSDIENLFGIYVKFLLIADWDPRHKYSFGVLPKNSDMAKLLGMHTTRVSRNKAKLTKSGLLENVGGVTRVKFFDFTKTTYVNKLAKESITSSQELFTYMESVSAIMQTDDAGLQQIESETDNSFSISSKSDLTSFGGRTNSETLADEVERWENERKSSEILVSI